MNRLLRMSTKSIKWATTLIALICVNAILLFVAITTGFSPWTIGMVSLLGALIGIKHDMGKHSFLLRVIAGSAGGLFVYIGLMMSIFGHLFR